LVTGIASVATLPIAVYATRWSDAYDLLHAGLAIPVAAALAFAALGLANRARRHDPLGLGGRSGRIASVGRVLGLLGLFLAASAIVALGVYALLEYVGTRE
jgi:hypothetical protein